MDPARGRGAAVDFILRFRGMEERTTTHTQLSYRDVRRGGECQDISGLVSHPSLASKRGMVGKSGLSDVLTREELRTRGSTGDTEEENKGETERPSWQHARCLIGSKMQKSENTTSHTNST